MLPRIATREPLILLLPPATIWPSHFRYCARHCRRCTVCFEKFSDGDDMRRLACGHEFHAPCVDSWLALRRTCPVCRLDATGKPPAAPPPARNAGASHSAVGSTGRSEAAPDAENVLVGGLNAAPLPLPSVGRQSHRVVVVVVPRSRSPRSSSS